MTVTTFALQVVQAIAQQLATLNTNIRYLHSSIVEFAERLTATLPLPLQVELWDFANACHAAIPSKVTAMLPSLATTEACK